MISKFKRDEAHQMGMQISLTGIFPLTSKWSAYISSVPAASVTAASRRPYFWTDSSVNKSNKEIIILFSNSEMRFFGTT